MSQRVISISDIPLHSPFERALEHWALPVVGALAFWVVISALCVWGLDEGRSA